MNRDDTYTIATPSDQHDTLFYVERKRWSPEYPDAFKFATKAQAEHHLANIKRMNPDYERYQRAYVC
jgi:hypothetical protein